MAAILICKLGGENQKIEPGRQVIRNQHPQIDLKMLSKKEYTAIDLTLEKSIREIMMKINNKRI